MSNRVKVLPSLDIKGMTIQNFNDYMRGSQDSTVIIVISELSK